MGFGLRRGSGSAGMALRVAVRAATASVVLLLLPPRGAVALGTPVDVAESAGIYEITTSWDIAVDDFDGDGQQDVLIGRHQLASRLYRNDGAHFTEVFEGTFAARDRHDCAWADVDQDGRDDMYCSIGAVTGKGAGANELWMQGPDGSFSDHAADYGVTDVYGRGREVTFIDVNHDRFPDLFVGNEFPRKDDKLSPNRLFINVGGTSFLEDARAPINVELGARCAQAADFDGDGWQDLLVCGQRGQPLKLYRNDGGLGFVDVTASVGIQGPAGDARLVDVDADGDLDLVRLARGSIRLQLADMGGFSAPSTISRLTAGISFSVGDANDDSQPDLYVVDACDASGTNVADHLLLGDGHGGFAETPIPQVSSGCGDVSAPIDYDGNGTDDFIVLNGHRKLDGVKVTGPVELISFPS